MPSERFYELLNEVHMLNFEVQVQHHPTPQDQLSVVNTVNQMRKLFNSLELLLQEWVTDGPD